MKTLPADLKKRVEHKLFQMIADELEKHSFFDMLYKNKVTKHRGVYLEQKPSITGKELIYEKNLKVDLMSYNYKEELSTLSEVYYECPVIVWEMNIFYSYDDKYRHNAKSNADAVNLPLNSIANCNLKIDSNSNPEIIDISDLKVDIKRAMKSY